MPRAMAEASTALTSVREGDVWRVQIAWPNGAFNFFGKFGSEGEAQRWIGAHSRLTEHVIDDTAIRRKPRKGVRPLKSANDVVTGQADAGEPAPEQQGKD
jgi:hypothetical protein